MSIFIINLRGQFRRKIQAIKRKLPLLGGSLRAVLFFYLSKLLLVLFVGLHDVIGYGLNFPGL